MGPYARLTNANGMLTKPDQVIMRRISDMASWYLDVGAARWLEAAADPVVYEMLEVAPPAVAGKNHSDPWFTSNRSRLPKKRSNWAITIHTARASNFPITGWTRICMSSISGFN